MSTKKPLVMDDDLMGRTRAMGIHYMQDGEHRFPRLMSPNEVRDIYEAHLDRRDALIQALVYALHSETKCPEGCFGGAIPTMPAGEPEQCRWCFEHSIGLSALDKAKSEGFDPTDTTDK